MLLNNVVSLLSSNLCKRVRSANLNITTVKTTARTKTMQPQIIPAITPP